MSQQLSTSRRKFLKGSVATIGGAAIARSFGAFGNRFIGQPLGHAQAQAGTYPTNKMSAALPDVNNTIALTTPHIIKEIAPGLAYEVWAFNESGPGPHLHVKQGETVHFSMTNTSDVIHSIDFHAAQVPWSQYYQAVNPGDTLEFDWTPNIPGTFMYHCGTPPVLHHIGNGMHGAIIVQPTDGWQEPAREYVIVQHEFYLGDPDEEGVFRGNTMKMKSAQPDLVLFNGYMNQYVESPLEADPGELIRIHVVNCGPTTFSAFHVIGALFEASYASGHPANKQTGMQTVTVPPGGGYTVELRIPDEGLYPFVTHSFAYTELGAVGMLKIGDPA